MVAAPSTNAPPSLLAGLIGYGIEGSLTPVMHEQEGAAQGMRYVYRRIDLQVLGLGVEASPELPTAAERMGYDGLNITFPCKQAVMPVLYELSGDAADHQPQSGSVGGPLHGAACRTLQRHEPRGG